MQFRSLEILNMVLIEHGIFQLFLKYQQTSVNKKTKNNFENIDNKKTFSGEAITLRRNLATLVEVFGPEVQKSCIVMLTKEPFNPARAQHIQNICAEFKTEVGTEQSMLGRLFAETNLVSR